jgi:hypothetical protein
LAERRFPSAKDLARERTTPVNKNRIRHHRRKIAALHLELMIDTYSVIGAIDGDCDDRL